MRTTISKEIRLKSRPIGMPTAVNFELAQVELPVPSEGQLLVKNSYMSVDPYMRGRMNDTKSYTPPFQLGEALTGGAIGQVVQSAHPEYEVGEHVLNFMGWREAFLSDGKGLNKVDVTHIPAAAYLGTAGMPGQSAYWGLLDIGKPQEGETVFVSAAAGAVGWTAPVILSSAPVSAGVFTAKCAPGTITAMFSSTVRDSSSEKCWNTMPMPIRRAIAGEGIWHGCPSQAIWPASEVTRP